MDEQERDDRLREIASRFGWFPPPALLTAGRPPFDITKPNLHDTKAEFLEETRAVDDALEHASALIQFIMTKYSDDDPGYDVAQRVCKFVDDEARRGLNRKPSETIIDMILRNAVDHGLTLVTIFLLLDVKRQLKKRKQELADQKAVYWSSAHRAPNHYARTIALRFAKLVASSSGKCPTFGTSRDGGHPSTEFGRALEEIFELLGIEANVRHPARWAIGQLTDADLMPVPPPGLFGLGTGLGSTTAPPKNPLSVIAEFLSEDPKK